MIFPNKVGGLSGWARMLTSLGLAVVILTTGLLGWTLTSLRQERARVADEQERLDRAAQALREAAAASRLEFQTLLDETAVAPKQPAAVAHFDELLHAQLNANPAASVRAALNRLEAQAHHLIQLCDTVMVWRTNYSVVWEDLHRQRTMLLVRNQITQLRGALETLEGRHRLEAAKIIAAGAPPPAGKPSGWPRRFCCSKATSKATTLRTSRRSSPNSRNWWNCSAGRRNMTKSGRPQGRQQTQAGTGSFEPFHQAYGSGADVLSPEYIENIRIALFGGSGGLMPCLRVICVALRRVATAAGAGAIKRR